MLVLASVVSLNRVFYLHWYHWLVAVVALLGLIAPIIFARGYRVGYGAALSVLVLGALLPFWVVDRGVTTVLGLGGKWSAPGTLSNSRVLALAWSRGEVSLQYRHFVSHAPPGPWDAGLGGSRQQLSWSREKSTDLLAPFVGVKTRLDWAGFLVRFTLGRDDPRTMGQRVLAFAEVILPQWFAVLLLLVVPVWWVYRRRWGVRKGRRRRGLCVECGYSRQGIPADSRCPECGAEALGGKVPTSGKVNA